MVSQEPPAIKRGVYIGELSRLSVLCCHKEIYIEAVRDLNALYKHADTLFLSLLVGAKRTYKNAGINVLLSKTLLIMAMKTFLYSKLDLMMFGIGSRLPN